MPYLLSPVITYGAPGMWNEGPAYEKNTIYSIQSGSLPPVNYDEHIFRPHSLTHIETPAHTQKNGKRLGYYFENHLQFFYGKTVVIKLEGNHFKPIGSGLYHWEITIDEIKSRLNILEISSLPSRLLITTKFHPLNNQGFHDPNYILTLSESAAEYLVSNPQFCLYGTSWKSSDYNPGKMERPIHNILFKQALIMENLQLNPVPEGKYFMSAFPLPIREASESPVVPVLFTTEELKA
ncbi:MAG: hypothetical protein AB7I27_01670 [Bacteriovoracaceae bacterium]